MEWVKKQTRTGSVYYYNAVTGSKRTTSPNEVDSDASGSASAGAAVAPPPPPPRPRSTEVHNVFRVSVTRFCEVNQSIIQSINQSLRLDVCHSMP